MLAGGIFLVILVTVFAWRMQREETAAQAMNDRLQTAWRIPTTSSGLRFRERD